MSPSAPGGDRPGLRRHPVSLLLSVCSLSVPRPSPPPSNSSLLPLRPPPTPSTPPVPRQSIHASAAANPARAAAARHCLKHVSFPALCLSAASAALPTECRRPLNHDQGRRHKYFPSHARALAAVLARFHGKLSDIRFFLRNPSSLSPEHAVLNRFWCLFCRCDLRELGSSFACSNTIKHLASSEHLRNLKEFLRKHGGGMGRVDSFRVSEAELLQWEKGCETLNNATSSSCERSIGPSTGSSKDIQYALTSSDMDNFEKKSINSFVSNASHSVMPLQCPTNENYDNEHDPAVSGSTVGGFIPHIATSGSMDIQGNIGLTSTYVFGSVSRHLSVGQPSCLASNAKSLIGWPLRNVIDQRTDSNGGSNEVLQNFTPLSLPSEACQANMHTGAPPPWLEISEENIANNDPNVYRLALPSSSTRKSRKLNPKRVGAAWAEKRRAELEMEKRGETLPKICDANWLPNFGRVWQAGTRKESRKEFEMEKRKLLENESPSGFSSKIHPYISKRMATNDDPPFSTASINKVANREGGGGEQATHKEGEVLEVVVGNDDTSRVYCDRGEGRLNMGGGGGEGVSRGCDDNEEEVRELGESIVAGGGELGGVASLCNL
ncbi:coiled-coil domain containing 84 [Musa troglodytarum]|uniref:Coiled-coil domain containing 84 n=1 Tax=Musa troglodytarum TaxID=320322 RepID=A0A9E7L2N3_9LILI|nr:coiled-coil domain containing 84 [Musa troglodytarum]